MSTEQFALTLIVIALMAFVILRFWVSRKWITIYTSDRTGGEDAADLYDRLRETGVRAEMRLSSSRQGAEAGSEVPPQHEVRVFWQHAPRAQAIFLTWAEHHASTQAPEENDKDP